MIKTNHPAIKNKPPKGVIGPRNDTDEEVHMDDVVSKYSEPENRMIPIRKSQPTVLNNGRGYLEYIENIPTIANTCMN